MSPPLSTVHAPDPSGELVCSKTPSTSPSHSPVYVILPPPPPPLSPSPSLLISSALSSPLSFPASPPPRSDVLNVCDATHRVNAQATLENYYHVIFALIRGDTHRPSLPFELAFYVIRLAEFASPYPSKPLSGLRTWRPSTPRFTCGTGLELVPIKLVPLLKTAPLTKEALQAIIKVEVVVNFLERTEYYNADYWNKFHIGIHKRDEASKDEALSKSHAWPCFELVPSEASRPEIQPTPFESMRRSVVDCDHKIWQHIGPGDCIEVSVMTRAVLGPNRFCEAVIRVFETWKPSSEMLKFL
ncbi:hypothetical protein BDV93DRAFT_558082 [Ceratobasidium sp. AG-I]|nr:hypothetical protein BDV93DRAFT_558082 [Ceratobasidium sp. AG-I]